MNFSGVIFQAHDSDRVAGSFADIISEAVHGNTAFALGGIGDLKETLLMSEEWMDAMMPKIKFLEKEQVAPGIYRDGNGKPANVTREILLPINLKEQPRQFSWKDGQQSFTQELDAFVSPVSLYRANYYPSPGDVFQWRDTWRQVTIVKVDPSDYFQNTGFPVYIKIESSLWVPEFNLNGTIPCGPQSAVAPKVMGRSNLMPVSDVEEGQEEPPPQDSREMTVTSCGCPIKTPRCYTKTCAWYRNLMVKQ